MVIKIDGSSLMFYKIKMVAQEPQRMPWKSALIDVLLSVGDETEVYQM